MTYNKDIPYNTLPTIPPQWMTQAQMAELFQCTRSNVNLHLQAIYREGELIEQATCKDFLQVRKEGLREVQRKISLFKSIKKEPPARLPHV